MSILKLAEIEKQSLVPGGEVRFVHSDHMTLAYWRFEPDALFPDHSHPHEQVMSVIEGVFELTLDGETTRLQAGSVVVIPPNVSHAGKSISASRIIDVFHPVREDYR
jgi:quercetin dioxygenase-like cupin family protein